jgi:hypothetical protein
MDLEPKMLFGALVGKDQQIDEYAFSHQGTTEPCCRCDRLIWLAPSSQKLKRDNSLLRFFCIDCVVKEFGGEAFVGLLSKDAVPELAEMAREDAQRN